MAPMAYWELRLALRSRPLNMRITSAMIGATASAIRVSFQFRYSSQPSSPITASVSRTSTVSTVVAALVTLDTS